MTPTAEELAAGAPQPAKAPIRAVLSQASFRTFWIAQLMSQLVGGTVRFAFIWLVLGLSDWPGAPGAIAFAAGLPPLLLSLPAGVWSDRWDRRRLIILGARISAFFLLVCALLAVSGHMRLPFAIALAALVSCGLAVMVPAQQAAVPSLVPRDRLMTGVALQNVGMQVSIFVGALLGGASIAGLGMGGAFAVLGTLLLASSLLMRAVELPRAAIGAERSTRLGADIREGIAFALSKDPLRSLVLSGAVVGVSWGVVQINLPEISKQILGRGVLATSLLISGFAPGMLLSSLYLASRRSLRRKGLLFGLAMGLGLGTGEILLALSHSYLLSLFIVFVWGVAGGVAMTCQRSLLQSLTPDVMMGRVMGIHALTLLGAFPLSALFSFALSERLGADGTLLLAGVLTLLGAPWLVFRKAVRRA